MHVQRIADTSSGPRGLALLGALTLACASGDEETSESGASAITITGASAPGTSDASATSEASTASAGSDASTTTGSTTSATAPDTTSDATSDATDAETGSTTEDATTTGAPPDDNAYLHVDVWSTWWNDRTRCGAERAFLEMCQHMNGLDCGVYQQAYDVCDPWAQHYGQVGPEKQGEPLCSRGNFPDIGGCDASKYDFDALRFYWYGAEWQGNWPVATVKVFEGGADWTGGGELIALSNMPGFAEAAMSGIPNHGLGFGCAMLGTDQGDEKYQEPFGGFAWVQVPTGQALTVVGASAMNFANQPFQGCSRGEVTQDPWIPGGPNAQLGCVYVVENITFEPGHHYLLRYGAIEDLGAAGPPQLIVDGFALPEVGLDVTTRDACAL
ncbi:MAG: hypothetical protein H6713_41595 [Myxococcales bacterium]|nr:hypothetical protein [Myxococcales bacterium]